MKLALFGFGGTARLGLVPQDQDGIDVKALLVDVTEALPWRHDPDPLTAGWWRVLRRGVAAICSDIEAAAATDTPCH
ncbi:hypothetical protein [Streptomyces sp. NPDC004250]|uniref:hypothetical protein n=1 Tax=Streptomyces sp. NPDC004250 TaxID=3364692 RepID=UPI0036804BAD